MSPKLTTMSEQITNRDEVLVVGYAVRTDNAAEADPHRGLLGPLWGRATAPGAFDSVTGRLDDRMYAVLTDYESDHTGAYTEIVGVAVGSFDGLPEGLVGVRVPAGRAWKLEARGPMPQALIESWMQAWGDPIAARRSFGTDLEIHHADGADLYLAVD